MIQCVVLIRSCIHMASRIIDGIKVIETQCLQQYSSGWWQQQTAPDGDGVHPTRRGCTVTINTALNVHYPAGEETAASRRLPPTSHVPRPRAAPHGGDTAPIRLRSERQQVELERRLGRRETTSRHALTARRRRTRGNSRGGPTDDTHR